MATDPATTDIARLVGEHHAAVYRYAYRLTGSIADAEDLTQQVFLAAHGSLGKLRSVDSARSWLFTILRNCFIKNQKKHRPVLAGNIELDLSNVPAEVPASEEIDRERLQQALNNLPDHYRIVVTMFYYEDSSYKEIAEKLGLPLGTVMSRLARAKTYLRDQLFDSDSAVATKQAPDVARPRG